MSTGTVKWFNAAEDSGFTGVDRDGPEAFVHHTAVQAGGFRDLTESPRAEFDIVQGAKAPRAETVHPI